MHSTRKPNNWPTIILAFCYVSLAIFVCFMVYVANMQGYERAIRELDRQPRLWRCVLDPRDITSGVAAETVILATRPEIALRTAQEKAQWGERRAYVQPCTENYPDVISMRVTP